MKLRIEFQPDKESQRVEESTNFLAFWRDAEGHISWTSTGWTTLDVAEALAEAAREETKVPIQ